VPQQSNAASFDAGLFDWLAAVDFYASVIPFALMEKLEKDGGHGNEKICPNFGCFLGSCLSKRQFV